MCFLILWVFQESQMCIFYFTTFGKIFMLFLEPEFKNWLKMKTQVWILYHDYSTDNPQRQNWKNNSQSYRYLHTQNISEGFTGHYDYVLCYALVHEPKSTKNKPTPAKGYTCVSDEEGRGRKGTRVSGL